MLILKKTRSSKILTFKLVEADFYEIMSGSNIRKSEKTVQNLSKFKRSEKLKTKSFTLLFNI